MPGWSEVLAEAMKAAPNKLDILRKRYVNIFARLTKRNVLVYYSGWLQKPAVADVQFQILDADKTGIMACLKGLDRSKGLDLILHTPGGDVAATESIIDYLRSCFGNDIRAFVPQMAMSGGTLIAVSCKEIWMGRHSNLGPVDPQMGGMPAQAILEEFDLAMNQCATNPSAAPLWQAILGKLAPTQVLNCIRAIEWSNQILEKSLSQGMFRSMPEDLQKDYLKKVTALLGEQKTSKNHKRHVTREQLSEVGIKIREIESDQKLQDALLTLHHFFCICFDQTPVTKIICNQTGLVYAVQSRSVSVSR